MCLGVLRPCKTERDPHAPRCHPNGTSPRGHLLPGPCTKPLPTATIPSQARAGPAGGSPSPRGRKQEPTATRTRLFLRKTSACTVCVSEQRPFLFSLVRKAH